MFLAPSLPAMPLPLGTISLNRSFFRQEVTLLGIRVPALRTHQVLCAPELQRVLFSCPRKEKVLQHPTGDRVILLKAEVESELPAEVRQFIRLETKGLVSHVMIFDYDYWLADEILRSVLPKHLHDGAPSGFASTGHIAHFNLTPAYLPYRYIIGQLVLEKNNSIETVVNKLESIDNQFRVFEMELLAGKADYLVEHHESDCKFFFDFSKVYWNSRLQFEHGRLVELFDKKEVIADVFAGVGPFAVPAGVKGCAVLANDLNPESARYLALNVTKNRVEPNVRVSCLDGRQFIENAAKTLRRAPLPPYAPRLSRKEADKKTRADKKKEESLMRRPTRAAGLKAFHNKDFELAWGDEEVDPDTPTPPISTPWSERLEAKEAPSPVVSTDPNARKYIDHFVMNLPDSAISFLDAFRGAFEPSLLGGSAYSKMPMIHCYCFTKELEHDDADKDIRERVAQVLDYTLQPEDEVSVFMVRSVAPKKDMYCISFRLPRHIGEGKNATAEPSLSSS